LPESRKAYRDRITFTRKKGRWRAIAESKMAGSREDSRTGTDASAKRKGEKE